MRETIPIGSLVSFDHTQIVRGWSSLSFDAMSFSVRSPVLIVDRQSVVPGRAYYYGCLTTNGYAWIRYDSLEGNRT